MAAGIGSLSFRLSADAAIVIVGTANLMDFVGVDCKNIAGILQIAKNTEWNDARQQSYRKAINRVIL
jgi:hypothetical protein